MSSALCLAVLAAVTLMAAAYSSENLPLDNTPPSPSEVPEGVKLLPTEIENTQKGIEIAEAGDIATAVHYFREADRLQRTVNTLNNLGVTAMRVGQYKEAIDSFDGALQLGKQQTGTIDDNALENLKLLAQHPVPDAAYLQGIINKWTGTSPDQVVERWNTNPIKHMKRLNMETINLPENEKYRNGSKPFILEGIADNWPALNKWTDDWLVENMGDLIVEMYPHNMATPETKPYLVSLKHGVDVMRNPREHKYQNYHKNSIGQDMTYWHLNFDLPQWTKLRKDMPMQKAPALWTLDDDWIDKCFSSEEIRSEFQIAAHWRVLLNGKKGSGMFNHQDALFAASWHVHVRGQKEWHVCAPDQARFLHARGSATYLDAFHPDYDNFPLFHLADCTRDNVTRGEAIYYPRDYFHQTLTHDPEGTLTITSTVVDEENYRTVMERLRNSCNTKTFRYTERMCQELEERCFPYWEELFDTCALPDMHSGTKVDDDDDDDDDDE